MLRDRSVLAHSSGKDAPVGPGGCGCARPGAVGISRPFGGYRAGSVQVGLRSWRASWESLEVKPG